MAVVSLGQQFSAGVLDGNEGLSLGAGVARHPTDSFIGGIVNALVCNGDNLAVIRKKVTEGAAAAAGIAGHPGDAAVG